MKILTVISAKIKRALLKEEYLNRKRDFKPAFIKVIKVINSCKNQEELEVAENMKNCFEKLFYWKIELIQVLNIEVHNRFKEIEKISKGEHSKVIHKIIVR